MLGTSSFNWLVVALKGKAAVKIGRQ